MNVYAIQDLQNVETLSTYVDLQAIFQLIILILIVIISICTIMYIQKNIMPLVHSTGGIFRAHYDSD